MSRDLFSRYIWLIDTIKRYGALTREQINQLWIRSSFSNGEPMPRRTFYAYRNAIEELFKVNIECNPSTFEYFIAHDDEHHESVMNWLLNSASIGNLLNDARDIGDKIFLENVPSARQHLSIAVDSEGTPSDKILVSSLFAHKSYSRHRSRTLLPENIPPKMVSDRT